MFYCYGKWKQADFGIELQAISSHCLIVSLDCLVILYLKKEKITREKLKFQIVFASPIRFPTPSTPHIFQSYYNAVLLLICYSISTIKKSSV